ncbi:ribonuclease P protein subunit Rpp30 [Calliopsis andreniformis]|uniref:ribonuclease P protein subunit Rpp30 n=1 Tax=Calliopsis andreniformis TaxID=337506 RepID=UPI003FCEE615
MDIKQSVGFYDLCVNIPGNETKNLHPLLSKLYELGFKTVAINIDVDESALGTDKKKKKKADEGDSQQNVIPNLINIDSMRKDFEGKLKIFNRVTFLCSDPSKTHTVNHCANLKKYDIYAIAPKTQNALQFACTQLNADIITLKQHPVTFKLNKKLYEQAVERGIHFEIQYADLLNVESRKLIIHYSHLYHTYGKSKNVILSSGSNDINTIKNPYDLINLGYLLGLSESKAKASILHNCKKLLLKAERRRRGKAVFIIQKKTKIMNDDSEDNETFSKKIKL